MSGLDLFYETQPFDVIGTNRELRWRETQRGCTAYEVATGGAGGIKSVRLLRTTDGKGICTSGGVGDLIELIEKLIREKRLQ